MIGYVTPVVFLQCQSDPIMPLLNFQGKSHCLEEKVTQPLQDFRSPPWLAPPPVSPVTVPLPCTLCCYHVEVLMVYESLDSPSSWSWDKDLVQVVYLRGNGNTSGEEMENDMGKERWAIKSVTTMDNKGLIL